MFSLTRFNPMETTRESNMPRQHASASEQKSRKLLGHAQEKNLWRPTESKLLVYTSEIFNLGLGSVISSWTSPCQRPLHSCHREFGTHMRDVTDPTEAFLARILLFSCAFTSQWNFCLRPSFLCDDLCCYACHWLCWHQPIVPAFCLICKSLTPNMDPGPWDPELSQVVTLYPGLRACCLSSTQGAQSHKQRRQTDTEKNYTFKGADRTRV